MEELSQSKPDKKLRSKAERLYAKKKSTVDLSFTEADYLRLIHELEVHQIELEMQNAELIDTRNVSRVNQKKYLELYDHAPVGYVSVTEEGLIKEINLTGAKMLKKGREELIDRNLLLFIEKSSKELFISFLSKIFKRNVNDECEINLTQSGDYIKRILITGTISKSKDICYIVLNDITDIKNYEYQLIKAREKAEESDRLKSAFLANMSHEIRTPMNGIMGFADLLKDVSYSDVEKIRFVDIIKKSGERMLNIINDLIDISKVESGLMEIKISETNITDQLEYIHAFFSGEVKKKGLEFTITNRLDNNNICIGTDKEKLFAILTNLVKNAIKYTDKGTIELSCEMKEGSVFFAIRDTGIGISSDRMAAIFERFVQADIKDKRALQGAGLGLTISKAYVEMLGGKIWVNSTLGEGSEFCFSIQCHSAQPSDNKSQDSAEGDFKSVSLKKVLIVEDDDTSKMYLSILLKSVSSQIFVEHDGAEAINCCRNNPDLDLILMDVKLPIVSGYEAVKQIRKFNKDVIIIAQTAYGLTGEYNKAILAGCNNYLSKPISKETLFAMLTKYFY